MLFSPRVYSLASAQRPLRATSVVSFWPLSQTFTKPWRQKPPDFPRASRNNQSETTQQSTSVRRKPCNSSTADSCVSTWTESLHTHRHTIWVMIFFHKPPCNLKKINFFYGCHFKNKAVSSLPPKSWLSGKITFNPTEAASIERKSPSWWHSLISRFPLVEWVWYWYSQWHQ